MRAAISEGSNSGALETGKTKVFDESQEKTQIQCVSKWLTSTKISLRI